MANEFKKLDMFKVSFKEDSKKVQTFNDKATIVTLKGKCEAPSWFSDIPHRIVTWYSTHPSVDVDDTWDSRGNPALLIEVSGKAVCADGDTWDPVVGERIAEARAKYKLYKFMYTLTKKLMAYYEDVLYGNAEVRISENHDESPKDSVEIAYRKYLRLALLESKHLGELLYKV